MPAEGWFCVGLFGLMVLGSCVDAVCRAWVATRGKTALKEYDDGR